MQFQHIYFVVLFILNYVSSATRTGSLTDPIISLAPPTGTISLAPPSGTPVQIWPCNSTSDRQIWRLDKTPAPGQVRLGGAFGFPDTGLVLNTLGTSHDSNGVLNVWVESNNGQQEWAYDSVTKRIVSAWNGLCSGTDNSSGILPAGTSVVQVPCADGAGLSIEWSYDNQTGLLIWQKDPTMCLDAGTTVDCQSPLISSYPYCDPTLSAFDRATNLLTFMQPIEKAAMLTTSNNGIPRLGIPKLQFGEALHGVLSGCGTPYFDNSTNFQSTGCPTSFPTGMALGASFNRSLWLKVGDAIGIEGRALANQNVASNMFFTPDVNPGRDPRWGRIMEVASECPYVNGEFAANYIFGFQGGVGGGAHADGYIRSVSMPKHNLGYDQEGNGGVHDRTNFCADIAPVYLTSYFMPPFKAALQRGKAGGIMCAANGYNSKASCAHGDINNGVFRDLWGGDFAMVTDGNGVGYLYETYGSHASALGCNNAIGATGPTNAVKIGLLGGVDVELGETLNNFALAAIADGNITMSDIETALMRTIPMIFRLGLVDPPEMVPFSSLGPKDVDTMEHRQLAREAAQQAVILLRNEVASGMSSPLLPLSLSMLSSSKKTLAVIGYAAQDSSIQLANYHGTNTLADSHTPLLAIQNAAASAPGGPIPVSFSIGCVDGVPCTNSSGFQEAVNAAREASIALVFVGLAPSNGGGQVPGKIEGEELDRVNLTLPGLQEDLIAAIADTGTPIVLIIERGGAVALSDTLLNDIARIPTIIHFPYAGELAGDALVDVLTGVVSPSGRLTTTQYEASFVNNRSIVDYNLSSVDGITYMYYRGNPQFPFGFGLSYTSFNLTWFSSFNDASKGDDEEEIKKVHLDDFLSGKALPQYQVNVINTGSITSDVSVLAFIDGPNGNDPNAPLQQLFDFQRVSQLAPGQTVSLLFTVGIDSTASVLKDGTTKVVVSKRRVRIGFPGEKFLSSHLEIIA
jgi:beta-D-xylosidase 4